MNARRLLQAIHNNAVCCSHGHPGEFFETIWMNQHTSPPFFPNAVTLTPDQVDSQLAHIGNLVTAGLPGSWGVKDSFRKLDLKPLGFENVFEGQWICRETQPAGLRRQIPGMQWMEIRTTDAQTRWECGWRGMPPGETIPFPERVFLPALLSEENVVLIAGCLEGELVAGVVVTRTGEVAGISNLFVPAGDSSVMREACVHAAFQVFPGLPLVGYEGGHELAGMRSLGFELLGPLRVWLKISEG